ncbi:hypothetical protein ACFP7A_09900 [Sporolactobacillus kofuensis]|uniref:Chemotaxis methyl-accepting receptor HlyB-like 4HB MCP domain-containing protein n=1 Tax=Sporolactobacillus kofuensis TaxID=269672 RepID=A0ABW1WIL5_9BACL|nr:hypothetical protein [Sporolactobacillus kofuensis]MCO7176189.1 hypothetical protein [Sporolactobacillus kofuensis]
MRNLITEITGWRHLKISMKFAISLLIVLGMMLITAIISTFMLYQTLERAKEASRAGEHAAQITEVGSLFRAKDARVIDYLLDPGDASVKLYSQDQQQLTQAEKQLQPAMKTEAQKKWFNQIMTDDARTFNLFQSEFVPAVLMKRVGTTMSTLLNEAQVLDDTSIRFEQLIKQFKL